MLRFLIALCLLAAALPGRAQSYTELRVHIVVEEGYSLKPYVLRGVYHVGIGHRVYGVPRTLTKREVEHLFAADLKKAGDTVYVSTLRFSRHPKVVRVMLVSLAFNVGTAGYLDFTRFRAAIDARDYRTAARELQASNWARQLPNRAARYIAALNSL